MRCLPAVLSLSLLLACTGGGGGSSGGSDDGGSEDGSTAGPASTGDATGETGTPTTAETSTTDATGEPTTTTDTTTGQAGFCHGWQTAAGAPFLELYGLDDAPLVDGGTLTLECGPQGLFMFGLYPKFGGFTPADDQIQFDLVVDVAGQNTNPDGHFFSTVDLGYYVGCEDLIGGVFGVVPVIPPDNADVPALDGLAADLHVTMKTPAGDVTLDFKQTLSAVKNDSWRFCGG